MYYFSINKIYALSRSRKKERPLNHDFSLIFPILQSQSLDHDFSLIFLILQSETVRVALKVELRYKMIFHQMPRIRESQGHKNLC